MKHFLKVLLLFLVTFSIASRVLAQDKNPPIVSVIAQPPEATINWQNTNATASVACTDDTGCNSSTYRLYSTSTPISSCPPSFEIYTLNSPQIISSHQWVCGTAKDLANNVGFSTPLEFKVDTSSPSGTIDAIPKEVRANQTFNITVSGEDNIDMGFVCYKSENDPPGVWTCYDCAGVSTSCSYTFSRSESALKKYKYYGQVRDFVGNVSFTKPDFVVVTVETDPSVVTLSVNLRKTEATLYGYLTNMGGADSVKVWFEWGETTNYGNKTAETSLDNTGSFSIVITGLSERKVYHFRAVAKNGVGTSYGDDMVTTELIKNGSFETGSLDGWEEAGTGDYKADTIDKYSGVYAALIGYRDAPLVKDGKSAIYQKLTLPSAATKVELSLWYKFYTTDKCDFDFINIYLKDVWGRTLKTYLEWCCSDCKVGELNTYGWNQITDDLSAFAGKTVFIYFEVENNSDKRHRSWAYIDKVSVKYIPIVLPSVTTKPATGIKTSEAILNGELTDMGEADSVEVWFVWDYLSHSNWQDYPNKTESLSQTSVGLFSTQIGNLKAGTTYHFRAVAKTSAGTSQGDDLKFTTEYSAAGGWISPNGHEDPENKWVFEERAYDAPYAPNYLETYANNSKSSTKCSAVGPGWGGFIIFTLPYGVRSNKIRVNADYLDEHIKEVDIDVLKDGTWVDVYQGPIANCTWQEISFPEGIVSKARFRYNYKVSNWCYWLYEFQFYKVPDEPITPPAGNTLDATSIEKNSAILHGQVIDDGRELCQVRFQYGKTTNYEIAPNPPWEVGPGGVGYASGETFGKFISGLEEGVTYHFRAQIKNSAGLVSGADKTFFTQSAPSGWVSPQGFYDPDGKWEEENFAFDDEIGTYARTYRNLGDGVWSSYLYLTREEIVSDRIRFWARELEEVDLVKIDVYRNGSWINVYNGTFPDYQWVEASFPGGKVSQARIQFHARYSNRYFYYHLYEFDFWKIAEPPSVTTKSATNISSNQATLNGTLNDLGGAHSVEVWLEYGTTSFYRNTTPHYSMSAIGDFSVTVFDLIPATTYHFRAVASSSAGISYGGDKTFTTLGQCNPGATTTCTSEEGCDHIVECPAEGYWPSCPRDECCKLAECLLEGGRSPDCPCPPPPPGYLSPGYGYCTDSCTCNTSTDPGGPCEPWPINRSPNVSKPDETQNFCAWGTSPQVAPGLSITLHWTYSDPDGDLPAGYEVWIDTDSNFHNDDPRFKFKVEGNQSTSYTINLSDNQSTRADKLTYPLSWNTTYYWKVKAKDLVGNWSDWSQVDSFTTPHHAHPYPKFTWSPQRPAVGEVIQFINQSECYTPSGSTTTCASFSWDFENGNPASSNEENPTITFTSITSSTVTLTVTDSPLYQYRCSTSTTFQITYPLPFFKEIPPIFFKMRNFFASLFKIKQ